MPVTKDIGGGIELLDAHGIIGDPLAQNQKVLGIVDLANRIQQAPAELAKKQADAILAHHQVAQMGVQDQLAQAELNSKIGTERRAQLESVHKFYTSLPAIAAQDPETAIAYLQQGVPGATGKYNEADGTLSGFIPDGSGGIRTITVPTRKITDPEKALTIEEGLRKQLTSTPEYTGYGIVNEFYKNFKGSIALGTGVGDMSATFSWIKMHDRQGRVNESQEVSAKDAPGVSQNLLNWYNGNLRLAARGARYGQMDSPTRNDFTKVADEMYKNSREAALQQANFYGNLVPPNSGINPRAIVPPIGDIHPDEIFGKPQQNIGTAQPGAPGGTQSTFSPKRPGASEAGVIPTGANPEAGKLPTASELPIKPSQQLDQLTGQLLSPLLIRKPKSGRPY